MTFALFAVALLALVGTAFAVKAIPTKVTLENVEEGVYTGKVTADRGCHKNRQVTVYHDTNGNGEVDPSDFIIGSARTDRKGNYRVTGNQAPFGDRIIASVKAKNRTRYKCKKGEVVEEALVP